MKFSKANFIFTIADIFSTIIAIGFGRFTYTPNTTNLRKIILWYP